MAATLLRKLMLTKANNLTVFWKPFSSTAGLRKEEITHTGQTNEPGEYCIPKQGSFILVDYSTKKSKKIFLGQLVQSDPQRLEHEVSFLRAVDDKKTSFRFPNNEDVAWISDEQIVRKFEEDDPRLARFLGKEKLVNPQFAIDLINSIPPKPVKDRVVWCDGGGGALGHPKVYINLDKPGPKACGYCGLRFVLEHHH